jgi:hypothetical protein
VDNKYVGGQEAVSTATFDYSSNKGYIRIEVEMNWKLVHPNNVNEVLLSSSFDADPALFYNYLESNVFSRFLRASGEGKGPEYAGEEADVFVEDLAAQVVRGAPHHLVGSLLSCLSCAFWVEGGPRELATLPDANPRSICGNVFKVGEVVWTCRQCAKDSTCVQCDACFKASDHEGHEVYFHRAAATSGGCCDCGDDEAWAIKGNCTKHSSKGNERDPLEALPAEVKKGLTAVMKGALGVSISFTTLVVRGYNVKEYENPFTYCLDQYRKTRSDWHTPYERSREDDNLDMAEAMAETNLKHINHMDCNFVLSLHNDDVHTYDEVIRAITQIVLKSHDTASISKAEAWTKAVDQEGYAVVAKVRIDGSFGKDQSNALKNLHDMANQLNLPLGESGKGLITSILPEPVVEMERCIEAYLHWVQLLGKDNDGICRLMTEVLLMNTEDLPEHAVAMVNHNEQSGVAYGVCRPTEIFHGDLKMWQDLPSMDREFPIYLKHLSDYVAEINRGNEDLQLDENKENNTRINMEAVRLTTKPFKENCQRNALAVLIMGSAFLFKRMKDRVSSLAVIFQQDMTFKSYFSQILTVLYPSLYALFARYMGTKSDEIFNTTVQVYTANRIVTMMSSDGYIEGQRPMPEPVKGHVCIARMLAHTIYTTLLHIGCDSEINSRWPLSPERDNFLKAHALTKHRHQQIFRDFEYVTENIVGNLNLLAGERDPGLLWIWLAICTMLQGMYSVKRVVDAHVEHEEQVMWHTSTNLTLEMESASTNIISNGLFPSEEALVAESQVASGKDDDLDMRALQNHAVANAAAVFAEGFQKWAHDMYTRDLYVQKLGESHDTVEPNEDFRETGRHEGSLECLGVTVVLPRSFIFMRFVVAEDYVSINIPLHRLMSKLFMYSAYNDLDLQDPFKAISSMPPSAVLSLADYSLRVMVFAHQVDSRIWVRNGQAVSNLAFNYFNGPIVKYLKVMDIHAVQLALISLGEIHGPNIIMSLIIDRCGLSKSLNKQYLFFENAPHYLVGPSNWGRKSLYEHRGAMVGYLLKILIDIIVNTPNNLTAFTDEAAKAPSKDGEEVVEYADSVENALSREVASLVLSGANSLGELQVAKMMVGGDKTVNDSISYKVMEKLCNKKGGEGEKQGSLEPRPETFKFFDPEFTHRSQDQLNKAVDEVRQERQKNREKKSDDGATHEDIPILLPEVIPAANRYFEPVRNLLYQPMFYNLLSRCIELALAPKVVRAGEEVPGEMLLGPSSRIVAERVIYLLTVHVHLKNRRRVMTTTRSEQVYNKEATEDDGRIDSETIPDIETNSGRFDYKEASRLTVANCSELLKAIADLWHSPIVSDDPLYKDGLFWVIKQIAMDDRNDGALEYFGSRGLVFRRRTSTFDASPLDERRVAMEKKKAAAQRSAMMNMQAQAAAFADMMDDMTSSDEDESPDASPRQTDASGDGPKKPATRNTPKCIVCREADGDSSIGTLCFLQSSSVVKNSILHHASNWHEASDPISEDTDSSHTKSMYRVVSRRGCFIYKSMSETSPLQSVRSANVVGRLAHGEHIVISHRVSRWVHAVSPLEGWVEIYSERAKSQKEKQSADVHANWTNDKVFAGATSSENAALVTNLMPLSDLLFNKHGDSRLHASTCGHSIHFHCWQNYYASCVQQAERHLNNEFRVALDISAGQFTCPLCKSISNAWLPFASSKDSRNSWVGAPPESDEEPTDLDANELKKSSLPLVPSAQQNEKIPSPMSVVLSLLDTPDNEGRLHDLSKMESLQFVQRCNTLHRQVWMDRRQRKNILEGDNEEQQEVEHTKGVHILAGTIAYTILSNMLANRWSGCVNLPLGVKGATAAAFQTKASLYFAAEQLHLIRQMPIWFPSRESFEDCIGTPLKFLLAGRSTCPTLASARGPDGVMKPAPVVLTSELSLGNISNDMNYSLHRALATTPYCQVVSESSLPSDEHIISTRRAFRAAGIAASELWGFLAVPLLAQDLHMISVVSVASAKDISSARDVLGLMCLARLCQVLIEPAASGVAKQQKEQMVNLVNELPRPLPFRRSTSSEQQGAKTPAKPWTGHLGEAEGLRLLASSVKSLQQTLCDITNMGSANESFDTEPELALSTVLDAWIPFVEYALAVYSVLHFAVSGTADALDESTSSSMSASGSSKSFTKLTLTESIEQLPAALATLGLPPSLVELLSSPFLQSVATDWANQLARTQTPVGEQSDNRCQLVPPICSKNTMDPKASKERELRRFAAKNNEYWHETASFGYPTEAAELVAALSGSEIEQVIDKFREELSTALATSARMDVEGNDIGTAPTKEGGNSEIERFSRMLLAVKDGPDESEYHYQWRLLYNGELGPMVEKEMNRLILGDQSFAEKSLKPKDDISVAGGVATTEITSALKRQKKDVSDAVAFASAVKDAIMTKMNDLDLKSVEGHIDTNVDESTRQNGLSCLVDALMTCSDGDLDALKAICSSTQDSSIIGKRFAQMLAHKAKSKSAKELGVALKDLSSEALGGAPLKAAGGADSSSDPEDSRKRKNEEEQRLLSVVEPLESWKLVGIDPVHVLVDEVLDRRQLSRYRNIEGNLGYFFAESPFVGSVQGCQPCYDLDGMKTSTAWPDLSHMGIFRSLRGGLIALPCIYTDMIQRMRLPYKPHFDEHGRRIDEPAICLICGTVVRAGHRSEDINSPSEMDSHLDAYPGECTLHARRCGSGHGIFMNIMDNWVLILNGPRSCKFPALYLDKNGEAGEGRGPNRPLRLSEARYMRLEELYLGHNIASEISRKRLNQDRHIRMNYY